MNKSNIIQDTPKRTDAIGVSERAVSQKDIQKVTLCIMLILNCFEKKYFILKIRNTDYTLIVNYLRKINRC